MDQTDCFLSGPTKLERRRLSWSEAASSDAAAAAAPGLDPTCHFRHRFSLFRNGLQFGTEGSGDVLHLIWMLLLARKTLFPFTLA